MIVLFVHGWSVTNTDTYGQLPEYLLGKPGPDGKPLQVGNIYLGKYVSFDDTVTLDDISRAFEQALQVELGPQIRAGERFACITHSTGGPVIRNWMQACHAADLARCPLSHLIMLAPANHGSALAQLGKGRLSRIKSLFQGIEPGQRVLDWLELGSPASWRLNQAWLDYDCVAAGVFPFVLTGQRIDRKLYDALNSYTAEPGSDGVVRVAGANLNYGFLRITQAADGLQVAKTQRTKPTALGVLPGRSHSGDEMGIIRSVTLATASTHPTAQWVLRCLAVGSATAYRKLATALDELTAKTQAAERKERTSGLFGRTFTTSRYAMITFRVADDRGDELADFDLFLTAGPDYSEQHLPPGFFVDRQRNLRSPGRVTYYLDFDVLSDGLVKARTEGKIGFRLVARPAADVDPETGVVRKRLAFYRPLEYQTTFDQLAKVLAVNETLMLEFVLQRYVDHTVFRLTNNLTPGPIDPTPSGKEVDWDKPQKSP